MIDITKSLASGDIVSGLDPSELVEIQRIAPFGSKTLVEGVGVQSRRIIKRPLASDELERLVKVRGAQFTYDGDAQSHTASRLCLLGTALKASANLLSDTQRQLDL